MDPARAPSRGMWAAVSDIFHGDLLKQTLEFGSLTIFASLLLLALHIYSSRKLGPAGYGEVGVLLSLVSALLIILSSVYLIINKFIVQYSSRAQEENIKFLIKLTFGDTILLGFAAFIICVLLSEILTSFFHFEQSSTFVFFGLLVWVSFVDPVLEGVYKGLARFRYVGMFRIIEAVARLGLVILFLQLGWGVNGVVLGFAAGTLLGIVFCLRPLTRFRNTNSNRIYLREFYRYAIPVIAGSLGIALLLNIDVVLVKHYFPPAQAGAYAAASMIAKLSYLVSASLGGVMFSNVARDFADGKQIRSYLRNTLITFGFVGFVALAVVYAFPAKIGTLVFGPKYDVGGFLFWYVLAFVCFSFVNIFVLYDLARKKYAILWLLCFAVPLEIAAIILFHGSINEVVLTLLAIMGALLASTLVLKKSEII